MSDDRIDSRYRIRAPLRCDGIGRLDCAEDAVSGERVAVRWIPLEAGGEAAARAMGSLPQHPRLPRIRQTGRAGSSAWVAMDFPDGQTLAALMGRTMDAARLGQIAAQVADALSAIHQQGLVHGELSAESILLLGDGRALLWDVPLVVANRLTDRRGEERAMAQVVHVAPFLSPERARGKAPSAAADVYALAAVLCLAGGAKPPAAASTLSVVFSIANGQWRPAVPVAEEPLRAVLERMLAAEPAQRPSARGVVELLADVEPRTETLVPAQVVEPRRPRALEPLAASPAARVPKVVKRGSRYDKTEMIARPGRGFLRRRRWAIGFLLLATVAALCFAAFTAYQYFQAEVGPPGFPSSE